MATRTLSRWHKASAIVPMALLVTAWSVALTNSGLATADDRAASGEIPDVPSTPIEQPASVQESPAGIDPRAGADGAVSTLSTNGIPASALSAYRRAESLLGQAAESCNLPWHLVAAIGRVESNHGRFGGNALDADGTAQPGIYGIALDGTNGTARIMDTDNGALDNDRVYDRAVGPMQFIPGTWNAVGVDADGDGEKNPQNIYDAATSAGIYLCSGGADLSDSSDVAASVKRYNRSDSYVDLVMRISQAYADGDFSQAPNGTPSGSVITSRSFDQSLSSTERDRAAADQRRAEREAREAQREREAREREREGSGAGSGSGTPSTGGGTTGGSSGGGSSSGGSSGGGGSTGGSGGTSSPPRTVGGAVSDIGSGTPLAPVTDTVGGLLSLVEANATCLLRVPLGIPQAKFRACMAEYGY